MLTEQQRKYAEARFAGLGKKDSALAAGCPAKSASQAGSRLEKHPNVVAHLARLKAAESESIPAAGVDAPPPGLKDEGEFYEDPKEFLRAVMNDRQEDRKMRLQAAVALLPYEHQKLGESGKKEQKDKEAAAAGRGRFAPGMAPSAQLTLVR